MRKVFYMFMTFAVALLFTACGDQGANTASKPANASNANTAAPADPKAAEADIRKLLDATQAGLNKNDADAMDKLYADNYMIVNNDGSVSNKAERLAAIRSGDVKYSSFVYTEPNIRVDADGSNATVITKLAAKGTFKGKPMDGDYRVTLVVGKMKDGWKIVSASSAKMDASASKPDDKAKSVDNTAQPPKRTGDVKADSMVGDDMPPPKSAPAANKK